MKRFYSVALICVLAGVVLFLLFNRKEEHFANTSPTNENSSNPVELSAAARLKNPATNISSPVARGTGGSQTALSTAVRTATPASATSTPATDAPPPIPPEIMLQNVRRAVHQYGQMFGGNPVGTNPEITAALSGKNPKQINFLSGQPDMQVNANGELVDGWGTPYFFHQLSGTEMEVHSAGPDKIMWTSDDLVTR